MEEALRRLYRERIAACFLEVDGDNAARRRPLSLARIRGRRRAQGLLSPSATAGRRHRACHAPPTPLSAVTAQDAEVDRDRAIAQNLEEACLAKGMRMTEQRRVIARVLEAATDHPDVEELYRRAAAVDPHISIATVYRTVKLFEDAGVIARHDFGAGRSRYETIPGRASRPPDRPPHRRRDRVPQRGDRARCSRRSPSDSASGWSTTASSSTACRSTTARRTKPDGRIAPRRRRSSSLRAFTFVLMPLQSLAMRRKWPLAAPSALLLAADRLRRLIGLRVRVVGTPAAAAAPASRRTTSPGSTSPTIGSVLPVSFVAKAEVAGWPVVGTLARLQRTDLHRPHPAPAGRRSGRGDRPARSTAATSWSFSPRGPPATATASCRSESALLGAAASRRRRTRHHGPAGRRHLYPASAACRSAAADRPGIAWYGDMELVPHFGSLDARRRDRRGGRFRRADHLRAGPGPQEGRRSVLSPACAAWPPRHAHGRASPDRHPTRYSQPRAKGAKGTAESGGADADGCRPQLS